VSEGIQVTVSQERVVLQPGGKAEVFATLQNTGDVVEVFSIEIGGIEADWYSLSLSSVSLFPGDKEDIRVNLHPPTTTASKAGAYNAFVKVFSKRDPTIMSSAKVALEVGSVASYDLSISPRKATARKGTFQVAITNSGNTAATYKLEGSDPGEDCNYEFKADTIVVEPGATTEVQLIVKPKKKPFTGAAKTFPFNVKASPYGEAPEIKMVDAQLECPPRLRKWVLFAIIGGIVVVILIIVLLILLLTMDSGGGDEETTIGTTFSEAFELSPATYKTYEIDTEGVELGNLTVEATWQGAPRLSLVIYNSESGTEAAARSEGSSPRSLTYELTEDDVEDGGSLTVYIANLTEYSIADGEIEIEYEEAS
jgi:hypothetical protein